MKRFIILLKSLIHKIVGFIVFVPMSIIAPLKLKRFKPQDVKRILVFSWGGLGNILMLLPFIKALINSFKNAEINIVTMSKTQFNFMTTLLPEITPLYMPPKEDHIISGIRFLSEKFKDKNIDLSFHPYLEHTGRSVWWARFAGSRIIVGFAPPSIGPWQTVRVKFNKEISEGENYLNMLKTFGIDVSKKTKLIELDEGVKKKARKLMGEVLVRSDKIIGFHCGSASSYREKRWGVDRFMELIRMLLTSYDDLGIVPFFGPDETDLYDDFEKAFGNNNRVYLLKTSDISLFCGCLENLSLFVTNDSGPMHLASSMDIPIISIWGPTDPIKNRPFGNNVAIIRKDLDCSPCYEIGKPNTCSNRVCLDGITTEMVFEAVIAKL